MGINEVFSLEVKIVKNVKLGIDNISRNFLKERSFSYCTDPATNTVINYKNIYNEIRVFVVINKIQNFETLKVKCIKI